MKKTLTLIAAFCAATASLHAQTYTHVECGTEFTLALRSDSTMWAWGYNGNNQLGNDTLAYSDTPIHVLPAQKWIYAATGAIHAVAIAADSTMWSWGLNGNGQLGLGSTATVTTPTQVSATKHWRYASAGEAHTMAILNDGTLWGTGFNMYGQLGTGDTIGHTSFVQIGTDHTWKTVSAGGVFTLGIKNDGTLWAWGYNGDGELGTGHKDTVMAPTQIGSATNWAMVSGGFEFSLAMKTDGTIWATGFNGNGELGIPSTTANDSSFTQIGTGTDWKFITAGASFGLAIKNNGTLWGWGYNAAGQLGITTAASLAPTLVGTDSNWQYISAADGAVVGSSVFGLHSAGYKTTATGICTAGADYEGQLGNGMLIAEPGGQDYFDCSVGETITTTGIASLATTQNISLYPNPATNEITITAPNTISEVSITNFLGQTVYSHRHNTTMVQVAVATLPAGIYFVKVNGNATLKFVKE